MVTIVRCLSRSLLALLFAVFVVGCSPAEGARSVFGNRKLTPYQAAVQASLPTYWWFADQPTGNFKEYISGNTGNALGPFSYQQTTLVKNEVGSVFTTGPGTYFTLTSTASLTGDFTLEWWAKKNAINGFNPYWDQSTGSQPAVYFFNGLLQVIDTNGAVCASANTVNDTNAHYFVVTRSGTTCTIYNNGANATSASAAWTGSLTFNVSRVLEEAGFGHAASYWQHGAIYVGKVLSGAEITAHYNAGI